MGWQAALRTLEDRCGNFPVEGFYWHTPASGGPGASVASPNVLLAVARPLIRGAGPGSRQGSDDEEEQFFDLHLPSGVAGSTPQFGRRSSCSVTGPVDRERLRDTHF